MSDLPVSGPRLRRRQWLAAFGLLGTGLGAGPMASLAVAQGVAPPPGHPPVRGAGGGVSSVPAAGHAASATLPRFVHFRVGNRNVKDLLVDGDILWVASSGGVIRYDTRTDQMRLFDNKTGLLSSGIFHLSLLGEQLAVGTYGGGLVLLDRETLRWQASYNIPDGLGDAFVYDLLRMRNGDVWIATWSGVNHVRGGRLADRASWGLHTVASTGGGLPNDWVYALAEGAQGELWLATEGGLARHQDGRWSHWAHADGLGAPFEVVRNDLAFKNDPAQVSNHHARQKQEMGLQDVNIAYNPNYIVSLAVDAAGTVWAGTWGGGLARFDGERFRNYTVADGLPGNHVFMLHHDSRSQLWIGTNNGLAALRPDGSFRTLRTEDGLFGNTVFSMATGADGSLWVGSFGGVAHLQRPR